MTLPKDAQGRKDLPITTGVLDYFPDALAEVARCSKVGNDQHNPGQPLHWAKEKSTDEADALVRHLLERGTVDTDGVRHSAKVAWRALALLQRELDAERETAEALKSVSDMFNAKIAALQTDQARTMVTAGGWYLHDEDADCEAYGCTPSTASEYYGCDDACCEDNLSFEDVLEEDPEPFGDESYTAYEQDVKDAQ